ncbi:MAG: alpha-L-fucosidase [Opitutaceae bacterium]
MKNSHWKHTLLAGLTLLTTALPAVETAADWSYLAETTEQHAEKMEWWNDARFGMFVHWGVYSATGGEFRGTYPDWSSEWMMNKGRIPIADYKVNNVDQFNPTQFDAGMFVRLAKQAGMKYIVITAKHHDGLSMFHSKASDYNVVDATPFGRDVMKELAIACAEEGIRFGFYYSQCQDWHHPGGMGNDWDDTIDRVSFDAYVEDKAAPEIKQLLTEYGPISIFWWDTPREMSKAAFDALHSSTDLQPGIITNDRLGKEYPGDHKTFERRIPRKAPLGVDWEVCMPISGSWGYKKTDTQFKSTETLIQNLCDIASKGGNYLLNVSPTDQGILLPQATERLKAMGEWMKVNSESIYGTTGSPFGDLDWGRCTKKEYARGTTLYFHVFDWPADGKLRIPGLRSKVGQAYLMDGWNPLAIEVDDADVVISVPEKAPHEIASVVVVKVMGALEVDRALPQTNAEGALVLLAEDAYLHNNEGSEDLRLHHKHNGEAHLTSWSDEAAWAEWSFVINEPGQYEVSAELSASKEMGAQTANQTSAFRMGLVGQLQSVEIALPQPSKKPETKSLGVIKVEKSGEYTLQIKPEKENWLPIDLNQLMLKLK